MAKITLNNYSTPYIDDDSGISIDVDNASSNDFSSSASTLIESLPSVSSSQSIRMSSPFPTIQKKQADTAPLVKCTSDGVIERIRPVTMKNSENGDYVICHTTRGDYVAYRTPEVPEWVLRLVEEVESREQ
ncbi:unnamed protein product [Adineta ricciae]|nr:unnamed protein product [Adineta ricciae]